MQISTLSQGRARLEAQPSLAGWIPHQAKRTDEDINVDAALAKNSAKVVAAAVARDLREIPGCLGCGSGGSNGTRQDRGHRV